MNVEAFFYSSSGVCNVAERTGLKRFKELFFIGESNQLQVKLKVIALLIPFFDIFQKKSHEPRNKSLFYI